MCHATIVHTNGEHVDGQVNVRQTVFTDFNAARCHFDSTKNDAPFTHYSTQKTYLWQVTARSRKTASVILPLVWPWNTRWFGGPKVEKITAFPETWLINDPETGMRQVGRKTKTPEVSD